jgi:hypothetical protein
MGYTARVSLPGYDAGTDTNLDHYSLYADVDNIMIKNQQKVLGTVGTAGTAGYTIGTIPHNLGYIPFYMAYDNAAGYVGGGSGGTSTKYQVVNNQYNLFQVPISISAADTKNVYLVNFFGFPGGYSDPYASEIFYDDMSAGTPSFTPSHYAITVSRPGTEASSTNPNDFIMHSDLNNYKILKSGTTSITTGSSSIGSVAHGGSIQNPTESFVFYKFPDGKVGLLGGASLNSYDNSTKFMGAYADPTNLYITSGTANLTGTISYYLMGQGIDNTTPHGYGIVCSKLGVDVGTASNPDNFTYHSSYPTLKYATSGSFVMTNVHATTYGTIAHNLGYYPFHVGFVNDFSGIANTLMNGNTEPVYAISPFYFGRSSIVIRNADIGGFVYADKNNIYFKAWFDTNAVGTYSFTFYYKIFKNNLGL